MGLSLFHKLLLAFLPSFIIFQSIQNFLSKFCYASYPIWFSHMHIAICFTLVGLLKNKKNKKIIKKKQGKHQKAFTSFQL